MIDILPATSFLTYEALALARPDIAWMGNVRLATTRLEDYAYASRLPGDAQDAYLETSKAFAAERYGGAGLKSNGGGARCGIWGDAQVKGLGKNGLAGGNTSFWHAYGGASLAECVREAIWGEVCHDALPWGAVRLYGVLRTGTSVPRSADPNAERTPRGLAVREVAVRPGHFIRANYYSRQDERSAGLVPDYIRTANAVAMLDAAFRRAYDGQFAGLNDYLLAMVERATAQLASACAKRISHGALTASNLSLDGKWLDFGTISTLSDFGPIIVANEMPDATQQYTMLNAVIGDLHHALTLYLPRSAAAALRSRADLWSEFIQSYERHSRLEFIKLTGIPTETLTTASDQALTELYMCMQQIMRHGRVEPFKLFDNPLTGQPQMPEKMGDYSLHDIMATLASCASQESADRTLEKDFNNGMLRHRTIQAYWTIRQHYVSGQAEYMREAAFRFAGLNAIRRSVRLPVLYRHVLEQDVDQLLQQGGDVQDFIDQRIHQAGKILREPVCGQIELPDAITSMSMSIRCDAIKTACALPTKMFCLRT